MQHPVAHTPKTESHLRDRNHGDHFKYCSAMLYVSGDRELGGLRRTSGVAVSVHVDHQPWFGEFSQGEFYSEQIDHRSASSGKCGLDTFMFASLSSCHQNEVGFDEQLSSDEVPVAKRNLAVWQGEPLCAHTSDSIGVVPTNRSTKHLKAVRVNTQTVESPWKAIR